MITHIAIEMLTEDESVVTFHDENTLSTGECTRRAYITRGTLLAAVAEALGIGVADEVEAKPEPKAEPKPEPEAEAKPKPKRKRRTKAEIEAEKAAAEAEKAAAEAEETKEEEKLEEPDSLDADADLDEEEEPKLSNAELTSLIVKLGKTLGDKPAVGLAWCRKYAADSLELEDAAKWHPNTTPANTLNMWQRIVVTKLNSLGAK